MSDQIIEAPEGGTTPPPAKDANDVIIDLVQDVRVRVIKELTEKGIPAASNQDDRIFLQQMLAGAASTAVSMRRIKAEENATLSNLAIAQSVAKAVADARTMRNKNKPNRGQQSVDVQDVDLVPGQTDVGAIPVKSAVIRALPDAD